MALPTNNLFLRLHKWASRQDENFLTESLAVVLEHLLVLAPAVGTRLVARLTGDFINLAPDEASAIQIRAQVETGQGRPDFEIRSPARLVWIEVKAESELRAGQMEGYRVLLGECGFDQTKLILLTRYAVRFKSGDTRPDLELRWFEVADWLESEIPAAEAAGEVADFLARQFLDFLEGRNMKLAHVGKYMPEGVRALSHLMNMLFEAATAGKVSVTRWARWDSMGLHIDDGKYTVLVNLGEPEKLWFGTRCAINRDKVGELGVGEKLTEETWVPGGYRWWRGVELESGPVYFFARSKVDQMRWLEEFLRECLAKARSMEMPDQPPMSAEPEEGN